jgi:hypothetical protein
VPFPLVIKEEDLPLKVQNRPQIISCVWDQKANCYIPVYSKRGQEIYNTPIEERPKRIPIVTNEIKEPPTVKEHFCGLSVPTDIKNDPLCGVLAIAVVSKKTLTETYKIMARKHRSNWKGATTLPERMSALNKLGIEYDNVTFKAPISLRKWVAQNAVNDKTYMITTTGHVQVVRNGHVIDQGGCKTIWTYTKCGKKVTNILEIKE